MKSFPNYHLRIKLWSWADLCRELGIFFPERVFRLRTLSVCVPAYECVSYVHCFWDNVNIGVVSKNCSIPSYFADKHSAYFSKFYTGVLDTNEILGFRVMHLLCVKLENICLPCVSGVVQHLTPPEGTLASLEHFARSPGTMWTWGVLLFRTVTCHYNVLFRKSCILL